MKNIVLTFLVCALSLSVTHAARSTPQADDEYARLRAEAEALYADSSYAKSRELYLKARSLKLRSEDSRWVAFRLADTLWRAQAATKTSDPSVYQESNHALDVLIRDVRRDNDRDRVWAEVNESLGDFWWMRNDARNWSQGWQFYQHALDWWAGSADLEAAARRYLAIIWKMSRPAWTDQYYYYGYVGNYVPIELLENALKIARAENDRAHIHYLMAMTVRSTGGDWDLRKRIPGEFEAAINAGRQTDWYDDALFNYAVWMMNNGVVVEYEPGQWRETPDYVKALQLFRRFVAEHRKGESQYYDQAQSFIELITKPSISIGVSNVFIPGSEIAWQLGWRNVKRIDLALYRVDLTSDTRFSGRDDSSADWIQRLNIAGRTPIRTWTKETSDAGDYRPGQDQMRLEGRLATGAYVLEAVAPAAKGRELILVTDASIVLKTSGRQALVYACDVNNGAPFAGAAVKLWEHNYDGSKYSWREYSGTTGSDGVIQIDLMESKGHDQIFAVAAAGERQAFSAGYHYWYGQGQQPWRIFAFTDRPAYRPGESVQWKFIARQYQNGAYGTPSNQTIVYQINDPRGAKVTEGKAELSAFGSASGQLDVTDAMPLGEYHIAFWTDKREYAIGSATLFRLEEYKLPEYKISVQTPMENGKKKAYRVGDKVEVSVQAEYYFGGAVSNASVEVLVYQNPYYRSWYRTHQYEWYYEDFGARPSYYNPGQGAIVKRETLKTDAMGKAKLVFETPRGNTDWEYRIEARVTDSSRREVIGSGAVRVTHQSYYVNPSTQHYLYRPRDRVDTTITALDANDEPASVEGVVKVTRDYWYEVWLDPAGREVRGEELNRLRSRGTFPPAGGSGASRWQLKFRGYEHEDILARTIKTDEKGRAELSFTPEREGYYRIEWLSKDRGGAPIRGETAIWVATNATTEIGYRYGGVQIVVDSDTFRAGQTAPVMLVTPASDRYVLFTIEADELYRYQLVHLTGTVKLVELPITDKYVPNIFLGASAVGDRQLYTDSKQIIVPPAEHFLNVEATSNKTEYEPREEAEFTISTKDAAGKPVAAEIAFSLIDESVSYIQKDYAGDPRPFFYGTKRPLQVQTSSTFQQRAYTKLVEDKDKQLIDDRLLSQQLERDSIHSRTYGIGAGQGGGVGAGTGHGVGPRLGYGQGSFGGGAPAIGYGARAESIVTNSEVRSKDDQLKSAYFYDGIAKAAPNIAIDGASQSQLAVLVRNDFRSTAAWMPSIVTGSSGVANIKVKFPESLTGWSATVRAATQGSDFGFATSATRTNQPLIVRLQAPRFFLTGDQVTVSAVVNNNTDKLMMVAPSLIADGVKITGLIVDGQPVKGEQGALSVPANGESRADWLVSVVDPGIAKLKVEVRGNKYSDAMEKSFPIYEHGIEKFVSKSGKLRGDDVSIKLEIPPDRRHETTSLQVQVAPSMAVTMLDALPYLIDYPYGCTEQTMSRFLPAAITRKTLKDLGLKPEMVMARIFGGIEPATAAATHPKGKQDLDKVDEMIRQGLDRLYDFQHRDGGWGWWKEGESDHFMTAYVVWGLALARGAGVAIKSDAIKRAADFLDKEIVEEENSFDQQAWMLHALAAYRLAMQLEGSEFEAKALDNLWTNRDRLNAYTRALLALSAHYLGDETKAKTLVANLENGVMIDAAPDQSIVDRSNQANGSRESVMSTAHWGEDGIYWRWSDGGVEATSFALRALLAIDPENKLVEPVTNWLIKNRRGTQWNNTRDTAITVLALNDYLRQSGELAANLEYELSVNGSQIGSRKLTGDDALGAPSVFEIDSRLVRDGANEIRIVRRSGTAPLYFSANARFFSQEEPVTAAGNEIYVRREYFKLVGKPTLLKGYVYDRVPLRDGEAVTSGDRIETVLTIEAKNNYEYLLFEDLKPAGFEAVDLRSGAQLFARQLRSDAIERKLGDANAGSTIETAVFRSASSFQKPLRTSAGGGDTDDANYTGQARWVYQELRDRKVALFIDRLRQGIWEIRYSLRAETPGVFHALPVLGQAMYVPEIRCNGTEVRVKVQDQK